MAWSKERLMQMLLSDRMQASKDTLLMLKSDILRILRDYLDVDKDSLRLDIQPKEDGTYVVKIVAKAVRVYH